MKLHLRLKDEFTSDGETCFFDHFSKLRIEAPHWLKSLGKNGIEHSKRLEDYLNRLIPDKLKKKLHPSEIFVLLYSVYLHDIGYYKEGNLCPKDHELRTKEELFRAPEKYLLGNFPRKVPTEPPEAAKAIGIVCFGHAPESLCPINSIPDEFPDQYLSSGPINLRLLSALLRMADEIDEPYIRKESIKTYRKHISLVEIRTDVIIWHWRSFGEAIGKELYKKAYEKNKSLERINDYLSGFGFPKKSIILGPSPFEDWSPLIKERAEQLPWTRLSEACSRQVEIEINSVVGAKYIRSLYVQREWEKSVEEFINAETPPFEKICQSIKTIIEKGSEKHPFPTIFLENIETLSGAILSASNRKPTVNGLLDMIEANLEDNFGTILGLIGEEKQKISKLLEKNIQNLKDQIYNMRRLLRNLYLVIDRAGSGKTNMLCRLAEKYVEKQPVVFISGKIEIKDEFSIENFIKNRLGYYLDLSFQKYFEEINKIVCSKDCSFLIFIDGINENRDILLLEKAIENLILMNKDKNFKVVISCRDIYWDFFRAHFWEDHFGKLHNKLYNLSESELGKALPIYLAHYKIKCNLVDEALVRCRHPLLLRFFCETYGDPHQSEYADLGTISKIRLRELFDKYLKRKSESIASRKNLRHPQIVLSALYSVAREMATEQVNYLPIRKFGELTGEYNLDSEGSLYTLILDEDIIIEEKPMGSTLDRIIVFVYEEFMEFLMAREIIERLLWLEKTEREIIQDVNSIAKQALKYKTFLGVLEYLSVMIKEERGIDVWTQLIPRGVEFQLLICRAIQKLTVKHFDNKVISILEKLSDRMRNKRTEARAEVGKALVDILQRPGLGRQESMVCLWSNLAAFPEPNVHRPAVIALMEIDTDLSLRSLNESLIEGFRSYDTAQIEAIAYLLGASRVEKANFINSSLLYFLKNSDNLDVIKAAINGLGKVGNQDVISSVVSTIPRVYRMLQQSPFSVKRYDTYVAIEEITSEVVGCLENLLLRGVIASDPLRSFVSSVVTKPMIEIFELFDLSLEGLVSENYEKIDDFFKPIISPYDGMNVLEALVYKSELSADIKRALSNLKPREEKILRLRFGIGERFDHTPEETAEELDLTHRRIRQIEAEALRKLGRQRSDLRKFWKDGCIVSPLDSNHAFGGLLSELTTYWDFAFPRT